MDPFVRLCKLGHAAQLKPQRQQPRNAAQPSRAMLAYSTAPLAFAPPSDAPVPNFGPEYKPSTADNMNGAYPFSATPGGTPGKMPKRFSDYPHGVEGGGAVDAAVVLERQRRRVPQDVPRLRTRLRDGRRLTNPPADGADAD